MIPEWLCKGRIIKCPFDYPRDKKKIAILLGRDYVKQELIFVLVNSEISKQSSKDEEILSLQIEITKSNYPTFITKRSGVSYVDCARIRKKSYSELLDDFANGIAKDFSCLTPDDWDLVYKSVLRNSNLKPKDRINIKSII